MKNFLNKIGVTLEGYFDDDSNYVIDLESSDDYNKMYSKLSKNDLLEEDGESSKIDLDKSSILFYSEDFELELIANFKEDKYTLVVTELEGE